MDTPHSPASGRGPDRANLSALIEQLEAPLSWKSPGLWRAYLCAALYGVVAALQGRQFLILFCGVLAVVFILHAASEQRSRKQIELLAQLVRELARKDA